MPGSRILTTLAALFWVASAIAQPALDHGAPPEFDAAAFESNPPGTTPMVLAPDPAGAPFQSEVQFAGPGHAQPTDRPTGDTGVPSRRGPLGGGAPLGNEFNVVTAEPDPRLVRFGDPVNFVRQHPDGVPFAPVHMPPHPSGPSHSCRDGNCFGHNTQTGFELAAGNPVPLSRRLLNDPPGLHRFQQDAARAHHLQENPDAVRPAWTREGNVPERHRWDMYNRKLQEHPNTMGQLGFYFRKDGKTHAHVDPTRGIPRRVELVDGDGNVETGTWQGIWHNKWYPLNVETGQPRHHDGYGYVRLDPRAAGQDSPGYVLTYNPEDRLQARAALGFQGRRATMKPQDVYPMPEFSADPNTADHLQEIPAVPLKNAYYPPGIPFGKAARNRRGGGALLSDSTD